MSVKIAVLIPCYNEAQTVQTVVRDFRAAMPQATIHVYDNASTDATSRLAREAGAQVTLAPRRGKGRTVRQMFEEVEADYYVLVDGDATYPADAVGSLLKPALEGEADMVVGSRLETFSPGAFRLFHELGNHALSRLMAALFDIQVRDVLSGYRVFNRDFVKSVVLRSNDFEIETEMTLRLAAKGFVLKEIPIAYGTRPPGSVSKLSTFRDGALILKAIFMIMKDYRPMIFFGGLGAFLALLSLAIGYVPVADYITHRYVYHVPLAILAMGFGILGTFSVALGVILSSILRLHEENYEQWRRYWKSQSRTERPGRKAA